MSSITEQLKLQNALKVPLTAFRRRAFLLTHHFQDKLDALHLIRSILAAELAQQS